MTIVGKYFPGQAPAERVFLVLRRSVFTYIAFLGVAFIMLVPLIILYYYYLRFPDSFANVNLVAGLILIISSYLLFILGLLLYGFVDYYLDVYIITDERIVDIKQIGFFKREIAELHLREVQDVSAQVKGVYATMFHFGDVVIQTAGERPNFIFTAIPHPYQVSKKIADLHEAQIEKEQLLSRGISREMLASGRVSAEPIVSESSPEAVSAEFAEKSVQPRVEEPELKDEDLSEHYSGSDQTKRTGGGDGSTPSEYLSDRGLPSQELVKRAETNVKEGLKQIDDYVEEATKQNEQIVKEIELKEGEVKNLDEENQTI